MRSFIVYVTFLLPGSLFAQSMTEKLDAYLTASEKSGMFAGSVLITKNNKTLLYKGYGYKDVDTKAYAATNTIYQIGSLTKQFTAAIVLKLEELGKLKIEDKLNKYFPEVRGADKITLEHLLSHTSGIYNYVRDSSVPTDKPTIQEKIFASLQEKPLDSEPGTKYRYNNTGYILLGYIIEKITTKPYEQVVREFILSPLQMNVTGFDFKNLNHPDKAVGYNFISNGTVARARLTDSTVSFSAGAMYSTLEDLNKWNQALHAYKVINEISLRKALFPRLANYGLGLKMDTLVGHPTISHTGSIPGFKSYNILLPKDNIRIILLSNLLSFNEARAAKDLISILFDQPYELPIPLSEIKVDEQILKQYIGDYQISPTSFFKIRLDNGQMKGQLNNQPQLDFFAKSEKEFFLKGADVQLEFVKNEKGEVEKLMVIQGGRPVTGVRVKQ